MTRSERALWRRWVERRDGEAFAALVRRHARFVYDFARRVAGNAADAEDLTQEAYLKLAEAKEFEAVGLRAFLGRRVVLGARMLKRAALARRRHESLAPHPGGAGGPEELARREEAQKALDLLPAGERRAVELRFLHDLSYGEIGEVLGTTEEAARMRVHRGLERVRARFGASACLAAVALFEPPARMLASTTKTALLTGGVVVASSKKTAVLVGLVLLLGLLGTAGVHLANRNDRDVTPARAPLAATEVGAGDHAPDTTPAPPAPPSFHGQVVDADGAPLSGATVRALRFGGRLQWLEKTTGEDGRFAVDLGEQEWCTAEARHPSYATTVVERAEPGVRIVLERGVRVRVEVRGGGGPLGGARVAAVASNAALLCEPTYRAIGEGVTDAAGVALVQVPAGKWELWASAAGWAPKLAPPIICAIGQPQEVRLELDAGGVVEGTVRDNRGGGVANARVVVQAHPGFRGATATGPDGAYALRHVPLVSGPHLLVAAEHADHAATSEGRMWTPSDGDRLRFDLVLAETSGVHGVVLDASGEPLSGSRLVVHYPKAAFQILYGYAWMSDGYPFAGTTDERGRFDLAGLPPGKGTIYVMPRLDTFEIELARGRPTGPLELRLAGIALRGRVRDAEGRPVAKATVYPGEGFTDDQGCFALRERPREIVIEAEGHVPALRVVEGDEIEVRLAADPAVAGTVIDPRGVGAPGVTVTLETQLGRTIHRTETLTDAQGRYRFRGAGKALHTLDVEAPGHELVTGPRIVHGPRDDVVLVVAAAAEAEQRRVRGTAVDEAGHPIEGLLECRPVGIETRFQVGTSPRAGWPGGFVCERLEPLGKVSLVFHAAGFLPSEPVEVHYDGRTPLEPLTVRFKRGAEVEVSVVDEQGTPVKGAHVFGYASGGINGRTDAEGRCVLAGLPPGRNRITVGHPFLAEMNEAYVEATAGARQRVEFRGKACGRIVARLPADAKASLVFRLLDAAGGAVREDRVETSRLSLMQQQGRRHYDLAVTTPGTYRVQCEIDGLALPEAEVEVRLRETVEVEIKPR